MVWNVCERWRGLCLYSRMSCGTVYLKTTDVKQSIKRPKVSTWSWPCRKQSTPIPLRVPWQCNFWYWYHQLKLSLPTPILSFLLLSWAYFSFCKCLGWNNPCLVPVSGWFVPNLNIKVLAQVGHPFLRRGTRRNMLFCVKMCSAIAENH